MTHIANKIDIALNADIPGRDVFCRLRQLYEGAFPAEERREWTGIVQPTDPSGPRLFTITHNGHIAGMLTWWDFDKFVYIEHFAVDTAKRGVGIGGVALDIFKQTVGGRPVVLEVEPEDDGGIAHRRIAFYRRHGFEILTRKYIQPPYSPGLPSVPLYIMSTALDIESETVIEKLYTKVYRH